MINCRICQRACADQNGLNQHLAGAHQSGPIWNRQRANQSAGRGGRGGGRGGARAGPQRQGGGNAPQQQQGPGRRSGRGGNAPRGGRQAAGNRSAGNAPALGQVIPVPLTRRTLGKGTGNTIDVTHLLQWTNASAAVLRPSFALRTLVGVSVSVDASLEPHGRFRLVWMAVPAGGAAPADRASLLALSEASGSRSGMLVVTGRTNGPVRLSVPVGGTLYGAAECEVWAGDQVVATNASLVRVAVDLQVAVSGGVVVVAAA